MKKLKLLLIAAAAMLGLNASAQLTNGTVYWIQDAATGEFISQGANWGTQATVQDVGGVGFEAVYAAEGVYKLKNIMWNKVNNANLGLNIVEHDGYCDQAASEIKLSPSGDGYLLSAVKDNNTRYICNNQTANGYGVKGIGFTTNVDEATVWKFLTKEKYDAAIQAYKNSKAASFATLLNYSVTTVSDLEAIITDENQFISKDYTSSITNAALNAGNTNGWTAVKPNQRDQKFSSENGTMAEVWNGCVVASQTVSGLPKGLYKVTFVGTFRPKGNGASEKLTSEQTSSPAYVFANDAKEEFIHWIDVQAKANDRTQIKNNAAAYTSSFYTYVTDGSLNLGVKQDTWYDGEMWCPFGYFTLTYYTDKVSDEDATDILDRANSIKDSKMGNPAKSALTSAISTFDGNKTIANYNALNTAITNANASIASYEALLSAITNANNHTIYTTVFEASTAMYNSAVNDAQAVYDTALNDDVAEAISNLTIGIHNAYENDYSVFANDYPYDYSTLLNQDMTKWASTNYVTMTANEHWNGKSGQTYYEQSGAEWGQDSWSHAATETVTLPKGKYVMSITARASAAVVSTMTVKVGGGDDVTVALPNKGASGYGITTAGVGSYASSGQYANNGVGYGWEYRYIAFEVTADDTPVTISFSSSVEGAKQNWVSLANPLLKGDVHPNQIKVNQIKSLVETLTGYENQITAGTYATFADHITAGNSATVNSENLDEIITNLQSDIETAKAEAANIAAYNEALAEAQGYESKLFPEDWNTLNEVIVANTINLSAEDALSKLDDATNNLKNAVAAAAAAAAKYYNYTTAVSTINGGTNVNLTSLIVNPSFEKGDLTGWSIATRGNDTGVKTNPKESGKTYYMDHIAGDKIFNTWANTVKTLDVSQTISCMPEGLYQLKGWVSGYSDGTTINLDVNGHVVSIAPEESDGKSYQLVNEFAIMDKGDITFKVTNIGKGYSFFMADDFELIYVGGNEVLPAVTAVEGKMNAEVAQAQTDAIAKYSNEKNVANYNAAVQAIANAQASIDAYSVANKAIGDANAIKEAHNFASAAAIETFENAIKAVSDKYDAGTLTQEEAASAGVTLGTAVTGNRANPNGAAVNYLENGFGLNDYGQNLVVNTWSVEGENDGSAFIVPFYEYWVSDASSLSPTTWTGTLTNLPNGLYKVSTLVRVRAKSDVDATDASGISINVNEGEPKDVTEGERVNDNSPFTLGNFEAEGLVVDGVLKFNVVVDKETNISWLSFKNVKYTKVRDLNPGEGIVVATAEDLAALNSAISAAETKKLGFEKGEYAPYNNVEALITLKEAKAIDQKYEYLAQEDVQTAINTLTSAIWTANTEEVNAVYDGSFDLTTDTEGNYIVPVGWTNLGYNTRVYNSTNMGNNAGVNATSQTACMFAKFTTEYGTETGYTMPLKAGVYELDFIYGGWNELGTRDIKVYCDEVQAEVNPAKVTAKDNKAHTNPDSWSSYKGYITIPSDGDYVLSFYRQNTTSQNQIAISDIVLKKAVAQNITISENEDYTPVLQYANVTFNRTTVQGWNGMVLPFDVDASSMLKVKTLLGVKDDRVMDFSSITSDPAGVTLNFTPATEIKAGRPFMVYLKNPGTSYSTTVSALGHTVENPVMLSANALEDVTITADGNENIKYTFKGTYAATTDLTDVDFALINGTKFYYHTAASGLPSSAKAFRAYLVNESTVPEGARVSFNFGDDVVTGINEIEPASANSEAIYNMGGQRVMKAQKGLYIQNGKKVVVK